jgi:hypothetical protein
MYLSLPVLIGKVVHMTSDKLHEPKITGASFPEVDVSKYSCPITNVNRLICLSHVTNPDFR